MNIIPAPAGTFIVRHEDNDLVSYDPVIAFELSSAGAKEESGRRVALTASGANIDLVNVATDGEVGLQDSSGRIWSGFLMFEDIESFIREASAMEASNY